MGIGNGNASNTIQGDYNFWFLPQAEDHLDVKPGGNPGHTAYYVKYRPVFAAAPPGQPVSPDLAGGYAADFALGAQLAARDRGGSHAGLLSPGPRRLRDGQDHHVSSIVTTFPTTTTRARSGRATCSGARRRSRWPTRRCTLPAGQVQADLDVAAHWARAYIAQGHPAGGDTFNLYDNGAIAEAELLQAMQQAP